MQLNLKTATRGPQAEPLTAFVVRELVDADFAVLATTNRQSTAPALKRISERHHALARILAGGASASEASIITGYDASRISLLQDDPTFKELLAFYRSGVEDEYRGMHAQLAGLGIDAIEELRRRVEEDPSSIGFNSLLEVVTKVADRTGHGPSTSTKTEVNVTVGLADKMKAAREQARKASQIDIVAKDITPKVEG